MKKQTVLCILDGYGISEQTKGNAIYSANTPVMDKLQKECPFVLGEASGEYVGLPKGQMGNSEVGHLNIGAGRIVYQELTRITKEIKEETFYQNEAFLEAIRNVKENNSAIHFMGLLSDGGVHSHNTHLYALLELAKRNNIQKVYIHCFMDGRDTSPDSGKQYIQELENEIKKNGVGSIATICGRYYAMDRDKNYNRTKKAYELMTKGIADAYNSAIDAIEKSYENGKMDEFVEPCVINKDGLIKDNDSIIFFNFRPDRARQITRAFVDDDFEFFNREKIKTCFVCFTDYDSTIENKLVAFKKENIINTLGEVVSKCGLRQLRIAETEKYAHVTFFMNGGIEEPYKNEDRILIPSPKTVPTYDLKPEMSAYEVCDNVIKAIKEEKYDLIIINFANSDMVGHTGVFSAAVKAVEAVDECVGKIYEEIKKINGNMLIIADHGNSEKMLDEEEKVFTAHTSNPIPIVLISPETYKLRDKGALCDIAPTILQLMNIEKPIEMKGQSLLV